MKRLRQQYLLIAMLTLTLGCHAQGNIDLPKVAKQQPPTTKQIPSETHKQKVELTGKQSLSTTGKPIQKPSSTKKPPSLVKKKASSSQPSMHKAENSRNDMTNWKDYQLEMKAIAGDVQAQYVLGRQWVNEGDSVNVVLGMKYLQMAAQKGHYEAEAFLRNHFKKSK